MDIGYLWNTIFDTINLVEFHDISPRWDNSYLFVGKMPDNLIQEGITVQWTINNAVTWGLAAILYLECKAFVLLRRIEVVSVRYVWVLERKCRNVSVDFLVHWIYDKSFRELSSFPYRIKDDNLIVCHGQFVFGTRNK